MNIRISIRREVGYPLGIKPGNGKSLIEDSHISIEVFVDFPAAASHGSNCFAKYIFVTERLKVTKSSGCDESVCL